MNQPVKRPRSVYLIGWCAILLGLFLSLAGSGNIVAQYVNYGGISEYSVIFQIVLGVVVLVSSIYFMKGNRKSRIILESALWLILFGSLAWVAAQETEFRNSLAIAMLQIWIPLGLLIYGIRSNTIRAYASGT